MEKLEFPITCEECNREFSQRVEDIYPGNTLTCPNCGCQISCSGDDGREAQKVIDDLEKSLKKMGGSLD